ncbi:MAG: RNA repair transcriptional activator RtcR family protein [Candidatus Cloacimonadales bacterium]|nr:RNA repair transcriptional activator RtcR family protein [Candidatus Cloacimonadota bacterium]MDX9977661.1 RNA repair transcriptional activator RtcR family protein [Candidatus Cloacimonadales bacterium]
MKRNRILLTFIGNNDCYLFEGKPGAIVNIVDEIDLDKLYILYNHKRYIPHASKILLYYRKKKPNLEVKYQAAECVNPTDYNLVYPAMFQAIKEIQEQEKNAEYIVSVTSGTPTMHACWMFLRQSGVLNAKMIQTSREIGISEINFSLDDFPQLSDNKPIKAELTKISRENTYLKKKLDLEFNELIGQHKSIIKTKEMISTYSDYDIPVFIHGESGTGKELVARALHYNSPRKNNQIISVNCGAISKELFESEFFGHKKGAFTGAVVDHDGYFKQADKGTLFLDEIADLPLPMQVKLLRVLENGEIQPLGLKPVKVDVRIISASHKNLKQLVQEGQFREDLFYRLVQAQIELLPLKDRGTDIILLAYEFLKQINKKNNTDLIFDKAAENKLLNYTWNGNIRELKNVINLSAITSAHKKIISAEDILFNDLSIKPDNSIVLPDEGIDLMNEIVPQYYEAALKKADGNAAEAARLLGFKPHTFRARYKEYLNKSKNYNYEK